LNTTLIAITALNMTTPVRARDKLGRRAPRGQLVRSAILAEPYEKRIGDDRQEPACCVADEGRARI
jgi:hypothetical protein